MAILYSNADSTKPYETVISTETLGAPGTFALVTIPQTYREVVLRMTGKSMASADYAYSEYELNGDSSAVYNTIITGVQKTTVAAGVPAADKYVRNGATSVLVHLLAGATGGGTVNTGATELTISDYTLSKTEHMLLTYGGKRGAAGSYAQICTFTERHWFYPTAGASAITTVEVVNAANWDTGSTFTVLGRGPL